MGDSAESRAALLAGAALLRQWVRAQRATWADVDADVARLGGPPRPAAPLPVTAAPPVIATPPAPAAATSPAPPIHIAPVVVAPTPLPAPPVVSPIAHVEAEERPVLELNDAAATGDGWPLTLPSLPDLSGEEPLPDAGPPDVTFLLDTQTIADVPKVRTATPGWFWKAAAVAAVAVVVAMGGYLGRNAFSTSGANETGTIVLESTDVAAVFIDGADRGSTPLKLALPPGKHAVEFRRNGATKTMSVDVTAGASSVARAEWSGKRIGALEVTTTPPGVKVLVDGKERGVTPLTLKDLATGEHAVVLQAGDGSIKRSVTVSEGTPARLNEAIFSGFVHVSAGIEIQMSEGKRAITLDARNQALLGPGTHQIRFLNRTLGYDEVKTVEVKPGDIAEVTIEAPTSLLSVSANVAGEVFVDGALAGPLPLSDFAVRVGTRDIVVKSADGERRVTKTITTKPIQVEFDFSAPTP